MRNIFCATVFAVCAAVSVDLYAEQLKRYEPTWESLDSRPLPAWYDESKLGIFIHWGVFSVIGYSSEWYDGQAPVSWVWWSWKGAKDPATIKFFEDHYRPDITYADFAEQFHATFYDPNQWADVLRKSGARYVVLTTKHHDGYTLWPSNYSFNWNAMDVGPRRDLVGEFATAVRKNTNLHFGLYHSLYEWFNPLYLQDKANGFKTTSFVDKKTMPELFEIVNSYQPEIVWSDGDWEVPETYWNSTGFLSWLYNDSPVKDTVVTNDRWGQGVMCHHGGFLTCSDRYNPGILQLRKWENAMTLDAQSWGFRRNLNISEVLTIEELIGTLAATVSCGGNLLVNVGPSPDGVIPPVFEERLLQLGSWMAVNGDGIYSTRPWSAQNDTVNPNVWYTAKDTEAGVDVYAVILKWDAHDTLVLGVPKPSEVSKVTVAGSDLPLKWAVASDKMEIKLPALQTLPAPQHWAYVLKLTGLSNNPIPRRVMALPDRFLKHSKIQYAKSK